ncbi:diaminopimelate epimerase [Pectinatus cerevisiiphilus]|uniref:Diaminopimelate epimerase n=1 Tax=Pectinatus cerevisiiphilus TaxID=86956 RepID=A0A4R3KE52_9FIRM|nr:diaminopimelate epimerase [Pectinatus cerevisiiphilus]TCS80921.1 diaminopimelate epimerase [Pectinatus cerevisiiphilus]
MQLKFSKWQGCGNDFVLVNGFTENISNIQEQAIKICDRNYGIGADGVILILPSSTCDFRMQIFNSDGTEAEMCGNGIRCFARYVLEAGLSDKHSFTVETKAGTIIPQLITNDNETMVCVDMGTPVLKGEQIPVTGYGNNRVINEPLTVEDHRFNITCVSMGNPHCVIFVDDIKKIDINKWGPILEKYKIFPNKTNVEFIQVINRTHLRMRVWERGAAITLACGTGACASLVAAILNNLCDRKARLELDGGNLSIAWNENDNKVYMTGPAKKVFEGIYDSE